MPKLALGRFVRLTKWARSELPCPVWGEIVWVSQAGEDADVEIFTGLEVLVAEFGRLFEKPIPIGGPKGDDTFTVHTLGRLPQYVLVALAKHKLLKGNVK